MTAVRTCLWYACAGEDAAAFYTSLIPDSRIEAVERPGPDAPPILVHFTLAGAPYSALNAGEPAPHSHAASVAVTLDTQDQADALYEGLLENGGTEDRCGWVTDRWGIRWQVIPDGLTGALFGADAVANRRAYAVMLKMKRLDLATILVARNAAEDGG